jgi:hypothetical protein
MHIHTVATATCAIAMALATAWCSIFTCTATSTSHILSNYKLKIKEENFYEPGGRITMILHWRRTLVLYFSTRQVKFHIGMPMKGLRRNDDEYC